MKIRAIRTSLFREGGSLPEFIAQHITRLPERSIVVVTSKIVALSEGRVFPCSNEQAFVRLVKKESEWAVKTKYTWLTIKDNMVLASAGIDRSNANGKCVLLPTDSYASAVKIRKILMAKYGLRRFGVLITDSRLMPLREGIIGVALGYAGFRGIRDYRGQPDLFGRKLTMTRTNVADSLATAAVLAMGEGRERQPLAVIEDAPVVFNNRINRKELLIDPKEDIYRPFFKRLTEL